MTLKKLISTKLPVNEMIMNDEPWQIACLPRVL